MAQSAYRRCPIATMADVARLAGVSVATVSHVLNGTRVVRPRTRDLVLAAVQEANYTPNTVARSLATARTTTIGLAISAISNPYFGDLLRAIEATAAAAGYTLLLADPREEPDYELTVVRRLRQRRVDGLVLAPSGEPTAALAYLKEHGVPTVLVDRLINAGLDQVGSANVEPVAELVGHFARRGHRRIALVAGHRGLATTTERRDGYLLGLRRAGLPAEPELVVDGNSETEAARAAVRSLLELAERPTAIIAGNNSMTIGTLAALRDAKVPVPAGMAVAGFDDFPWADLFSPGLTAIAQPFVEMGRRAVEMLLARMADPLAPARTVRLPPTFVHRDSCGCPR
ncbi:LacI family DNA-binding transcriptional regulator [Pseudonocardia eucalypti]|uniref:LacI family DNA-binding transcriptional regulator n=2 Tax=Pseudonocardia eucalypti TaxID=648755 RepID=A0ABP9PNK1_9PSEU